MATKTYEPFCSVFCFAVIFSIGCSAAPDRADADGEIASASSPILGGTRSDAIPAIGSLGGPAGRVCTATLISSRVILTAAHCFGFDTTKSFFGDALHAPTFPTNSTGFTFTDGTGGTRQILRFAVQSTSRGTDDVAVAEIDSDISYSTIHPLTVAKNSPANGAPVTAWGLGCTTGHAVDTGIACTVPVGGGSATFCPSPAVCNPPSTSIVDNAVGECFQWVGTNADAGAKTTVSSTWDATNNRTWTDVTCPGDSGGPILDSSGNIVAINSAGSGDRNTDSDSPANAVLHRPFISRANSIYGKRQLCDACSLVAFKTYDGTHYVEAVNGGNGDVVATATGVDSTTEFRVVPFSQGQLITFVALQSSSGRWVTAENGGGANVTATRDFAGPWETFILASASSTTVNLATSGSPTMFVTAEGGGGGAVNANRTAANQWEAFTPQIVFAGTFQ